MQSFLAKAVLILAAFLTGAFLRTTGVLTKQDGKAAGLALSYGTLPSLVLQTLLTFGFLGREGFAVAAAAVLLNILIAGLTWSAFSGKRRPDRVLLTGSAVGVALGSIAYAFVEAAFGPQGLHFAVLWDLGNMLSVCFLSYLILAKGGHPYPERYVHADGGVYRGHWQGPKKHGLGVYSYPGGGRYEGHWADNLKDGLGVYYFPKGGWYEGEWGKGERGGVGLRILSTGAVQAGRWQGLEKIERLEPSQCAFAGASAREVAKAAQRVPVGGGSAADIVLQLLSVPVFWAMLLAALSTFSGYQLPVAVDLLTAHLATAHIPLAALVFGLNTTFEVPSGRQAADVANSLALRLVLPLVVAAAAALTLPSRYTEAIAVASLCAVGPLSEQLPFYIQLFRLNEVIGNRLLSGARLASLASLTTLAFALVFSTPLNASLSSKGLALALGTTASVVAVSGSVAAWVLSSRKVTPTVKPQAQRSSDNRLGPSPLRASASANVQPEIPPLGIAWKERRAEQGRELAEADGQGKGVSSSSANRAVSTNQEADSGAEVLEAELGQEQSLGSSEVVTDSASSSQPAWRGGGQQAPSSSRRRKASPAFEDVEDDESDSLDGGYLRDDRRGLQEEGPTSCHLPRQRCRGRHVRCDVFAKQRFGIYRGRQSRFAQFPNAHAVPRIRFRMLAST